MSDIQNPGAFLRIAYCEGVASGKWEPIEGWESAADFRGALEKGCAQSTVEGLHPVLSWGLSSNLSYNGGSPDKMEPGTPGTLSVGLDPSVSPIGQLYAAHFGKTNHTSLINYQLYLFRDHQPRGSKKGSERHHYFTITGIAGRIFSLEQGASQSGLGGLHLMLAANRISWYDHDGQKGAMTSWTEPGKATNMDKSPI